MRLETLAVHGGTRIDPVTRAVTAPIHLSTTFERSPEYEADDPYIYSRIDNPNRSALETLLADLEGGATALAFASGLASIVAVFQALRPGDHVIIPDDMYFGARRIVTDILGPWGLQWSVVDMTDLAAVAAAIRPATRLLWVETPSNPQLKITDIAAVSVLAHAAGALCAVDNTWPSPLCQLPLALGADISMHATTKYLGGHSDILGGALICKANDGFAQKLRTVQTIGGAVPSPFECWLLLRSIRTLPWRMRGHCDNAEQVAAFLDQHPQIEAVHYPGLASHAGHAVAARQMIRWGGMLSVQVRGGAEEAIGVAARVKLFTRATSLGGIESLIEHRYSVEGPGTPTPPNLLRISVGLEHPADLIEDLEQALG